MARIPDSEIDRLKADISLVRLIEGAGQTLKTQGKDLAMRCPFHDGDDTPSFIVTPAKNVWHCFGCQTGGSVVDWVMRWHGVSFRHAVELLRKEHPSLAAGVALDKPAPRGAHVVRREARLALPLDTDPAHADQALLAEVIGEYHALLKASPEALDYLRSRGLDHPEVIDAFRLGFANRTLGYRLPEKNRQAGAALRCALQRIGLLRDSGHEHFNGSLVIPVIALDGAITEVYGRKITRNLRAGTALHLYLPGPHSGVFNEQGLVGHEEVILCEALIDALTFWCAGYRNVTASYGIEGFTDDHLAAFRQHGIRRVLIAYDADAAGNAAAEKLAKRLQAEGFDAYRCRFPKGMDANDYALAVQPAAKSLGLVIRQAEWLGNGAAPMRTEVPAPLPYVAPVAMPRAAIPDLAALLADDEDDDSADAVPANDVLPLVAQPTEPCLPEPPAFRVPPSAPPAPLAEIDASGELTLTLGERVYRVRGIEKNTSYEQLKVWLKATCGEYFHLDTVDLGSAKQRGAWIKAASVELGLAEDIARSDLGKLLRAVEERQQALLQPQLAPKAAALAPALPPEQHDAALSLLRDPDLIERIVADFAACGLVGEPSNALVGYLAAVSRKLPHPLAILIQSTSAAGKSTLMDAVLRFVPETERVHYSAMTGQSLFYLGEKDLKHKILAIAEEEGVRQAAYALKLLQSEGELTMASTGKDPVTGKLVTEEYRVEGPVMLFLTTTAIDVDEELLNRCLVLTIDESREQTRAILARQRQARTLAGLGANREAERIMALHRAAQTLLRPLAVVNPFAERLGFRDDLTRLRRDHQKYLTLIEAIAFLHQHQRPLRTTVEAGESVAYVEVTPSDIALANRLAHEVLGRSLDELPPQTRRVLGAIDALVAERASALAIERGMVRFTRRELRAQAGISDTQLGIHLERLVRLEYLVLHSSRRGQSFVYELLFDGEVSATAAHLPGLIDVTALVDVGTTAHPTGSKRPQNGPKTGPLRGEETGSQPNGDAGSSPMPVESPKKPRRRINGAADTSYPQAPLLPLVAAVPVAG